MDIIAKFIGFIIIIWGGVLDDCVEVGCVEFAKKIKTFVLFKKN